MSVREKLIQFQNDAERGFKQTKNLKNEIAYFFAFVIFLLSNIIAALTLPFRPISRAFFKKDKNSKIVKMNAENIESTFKDEKIVLIDFWAAWCGPCVMMNPTLEKFAKETKNVCITKVNADLNRDILERFKIRGLPHLVLIKDGQEIKRHAGAMTLVELNRFCFE